MAQDVNPGVAYLMALKHSAGSSGDNNMTAPEKELAACALADSRGEEKPVGAEKRRSPRYKCEGSAELREEGCEVRTWATFTDVSLHGCYVEAQATYPAGSKLHMKLDANGVRVETIGSVRVNYPYLGMGIAFEEISPDNSDQLKRLVGTLSHRCVVMGPGIASSLPAGSSIEAVPLITNPLGAVQALIEFFESRQILMRDDFLRVLKKSQQ